MGVVLYALFVLGVALAAAVTAMVCAIRFAPRWGAIPGPALRTRGGGAYRSATTHGMVLRGTPSNVAWTAAIGLVWSALTSLVFAPMLLCVGAVTDGVGLLGVVTGVGLVVTGSSGFFLGIALACVAFFVLRRDPDAIDLAEGAVVRSVLHHVAGLLFVVLHAIVVPGTGPLGPDGADLGLRGGARLRPAGRSARDRRWTAPGRRDRDHALDRDLTRSWTAAPSPPRPEIPGDHEVCGRFRTHSRSRGGKNPPRPPRARGHVA